MFQNSDKTIISMTTLSTVFSAVIYRRIFKENLSTGLKTFSQEMDISPLSESRAPATLTACQAAVSSHFPLVMLYVTLMY